MSLRASAAARTRTKPVPAESNDDRRFAQRKPRSLPAFLLSDRVSTPVPAIVRDLSSTGAKIELVLGRDTPISSADGLPANMVLFMVSDSIEVDVTVAWRAGNFIGVSFTSMSRMRQRARAVRKKPDAPAAKGFKFGF